MEFAPEAIDSIIAETQGYPYFLQEWAKHAWDVAAKPNHESGRERSIQGRYRHARRELFRVRFDRLTPLEKRYLRAMAQLGPGPHRSGDVAAALARKVQSLAPTRNELIRKGMVWSPNHVDTAFTVPLFDQFMKRIMPGDDWRAA